ncbi:hypothetical protein [Wenzhouxiangella sediminis]|uniref:Uncharacterized protein n=1 Tax=Wenzhouxiangella sediminis TaxID=1792836 RepID=A0A3E1K8L9_9GAMM|nr:hypothetical protein [Wenzhouxiangella sediminis]RFF30035.1 hypothetical protein DZC52_10050 [Wenzhouxiangella sediminis]
MKRQSSASLSGYVLAILVLFVLGTSAGIAREPRGQPSWPPPSHHYRLEHPQHRLAYWYANESMRQAQEAREMVCGFTGQHWTLDWEVHYRWALRAAPRRVYQRVEERDRHLATCRSRKLRDYQRPPYRRDPGGYDRG